MACYALFLLNFIKGPPPTKVHLKNGSSVPQIIFDDADSLPFSHCPDSKATNIVAFSFFRTKPLLKQLVGTSPLFG
jgi:hypothetical protein